MRPIPKAQRDRLDRKPFYHQCARRLLLQDHTCQRNPVTGRLIEWDHVVIFAGPQSNEEAFLVPICWWAHEGPGRQRQMALWIGLNRASDATLRAYSKARNYVRERENLNAKYGDPRPLLEKLGGIP